MSFECIKRGGITFTGNTVGINPLNPIESLTDGSIGTFISLINPANTTLLVSENGSSAILNLPENSDVLYAELIWQGNYRQETITDSILGDIIGDTDLWNTEVKFTTPNGESHLIKPVDKTGVANPNVQTTFFEHTDSLELGGIGLGNITDIVSKFYINYCDVTDYVKKAKAGTYSLEQVPAILATQNKYNHVGWTLAVIYEDSSLPVRYITYRRTPLLVTEDKNGTSKIEVTIDTLDEKISSLISFVRNQENSGRLLLSAGEGDSLVSSGITGTPGINRVYFGDSTTSYELMSGPNNKENNFFSSQINDNNGVLDTSGTFGDKNISLTDLSSIINSLLGSRQGWDITNIDVSQTIKENQKSSVVAFESENDLYIVNAIGLQVNNKEFAQGTANLTINAEEPIKLGDEIEFICNIENTGTTELNELSLKLDETPYLEYVDGDGNPFTGVDFGNLLIGATEEKRFKLRLVEVPYPDNNLIIKPSLTYLLNEERISDGITMLYKGITINDISVEVEIPKDILKIEKTCDKEFTKIDDELKYTIKITNTAPLLAQGTNLVLSDIIPFGTSYVRGSLTIDGEPISISYDDNGNQIVEIDSIDGQSTKTVTYSVTVNNRPEDNIIKNTAILTYTNKAINEIEVTTLDTDRNNLLEVPISEGEIASVNRTVDKRYATLGDTLTYTTTFKNEGNTPLNNVTVTDFIPDCLELIDDSINVTVNGVERTFTGTPYVGINIGDLLIDEEVSVSFSAKVISLPEENPIHNVATINYTYINPDNETVNGEPINTFDNARTNIIAANLVNSTKVANKRRAQLGDTISYTITIKNTGNAKGENIIIVDEIIDELEYIENSIVISFNPVSYSEKTVTSNGNNFTINLLELDVNQTMTIKFDAKVKNIPQTNLIENFATIEYKYKVNPEEGLIDTPVSTQTETNIIALQDLENIMSVDKTVSKENCTIGDRLFYTVVITNNSPSIPSQNTVFYDNIEDISNITVENVTVDNEETTQNLKEGIELGEIGPNESRTIRYEVYINDIPDINPITSNAYITYDTEFQELTNQTVTVNEVTTMVNVAYISELLKNRDKATAEIGDKIEYILKFKNIGSVEANNVIVKDILDEGLTYIPYSLKINDEDVLNANPEDIKIGTVAPNEEKTIVFKVEITSLPSTNPLKNKASITYEYNIDPNTSYIKYGEATSNEVTTLINIPTNLLKITKTVDKSYATVNDTLTYTVYVTNTSLGKVNADNVRLTETYPAELKFVEDTLFIDNLPYQTATLANLSLGNILPNQTKEVVYQATIQSLPRVNPIENTTDVYYYNPILKMYENVEPVSVSTQVNEAIIKNFKIESDKENIEVGDTVSFTLTFENKGNVMAEDLVVKAILPNGLDYIKNSTFVNSKNSNENPMEGVNISSVDNGDTTEIKFDTLVTTDIFTNPKENKELILECYGNLSYSYTTDPNIGTIEPIDLETENKVYLNIEIPGNILEISKSVDKKSARTGETLLYTVNIKNVYGEGINATNLILNEIISDDTTFVLDSIKINGVESNINSLEDINLGELAYNEEIELTYEVIINDKIKDNQIESYSTLTYTNEATGEVYTINSETVKTIVYSITLEKIADREYAQHGEIINYKVEIQGSGITDIENPIIFIDEIPNTLTLDLNSIDVCGGTIVEDNSTEKEVYLNLGSTVPILPITVCYSVTVKDDVVGNIENTAYIELGDTQIDSSTETVLLLDVHVEKTVNNDLPNTDEIITYTVTIDNLNSNVDLNDVYLLDNFQIGLEFINYSVEVNGNKIRKNVNPSKAPGVLIGEIPKNTLATVSYNVRVLENPVPNPIENMALIKYEIGNECYSISSNVVKVSVANLTILKTVDKTYAKGNDELTYNIRIVNTGPIVIEDIVVKEISVPEGTTYIKDSLRVDDEYILGEELVNEIEILKILDQYEEINIEYKALIDEDIDLSTIVELKNQASVTYNYLGKVDDEEQILTKTKDSNVVTTYIREARIELTKKSNLTIIEVGDEIEFVITATNNGNIDAFNLILQDDLNDYFEFVEGSVVVNDRPRMHDSPIDGIYIEKLAVRNKATIKFLVKIIKVPYDSEESLINIANLTYDSYINPQGPPISTTVVATNDTVKSQLINISFIKKSNVKSVYVDDEIKYTIKITNYNKYKIYNVKVFDLLPEDVSFVPASFVRYSPEVEEDDFRNGIVIGDIEPNKSKSYSYKVILKSMPPTRMLYNKAYITFEYPIGEDTIRRMGDLYSNEDIVEVKNSTFKQLNLEGFIGLKNQYGSMNSLLDLYAVSNVFNCTVINTSKGISEEGQKLTGKKLLISGFVCIYINYVAICESNAIKNMAQKHKFSTYIVVPEYVEKVSIESITTQVEDVIYKQIDDNCVYYNISLLLEFNM